MNILLAKIVSGCIGSCFIKVLTYPIDTVKSLEQCGQSTTRPCYFKGLHYELLSEMLCSAVFFTIYEINSSRKTVDCVTVGAGMGALVSSFVKTPLEYYKVKHQCSTGIPSICIRGMYSHFPLTLAKQIPTQVVTFTSVEHMKAFIKHQLNLTDEPLPLPYIITVGFLSGSLACVLNNPIDVLKTHSIYSGSVLKSANEMLSLGVSSLFMGLKCRLVMSGMNASVGYTVYETMSKTLTVGKSY